MQVELPFQQATLRQHPEPLSLVIVKDEQGKCNPMPLGWVMMASREPAYMALAVAHTRYTCEQIRRAKEFVICWPPSTMGHELFYYGTNSGRDVDKFAETPVRTQPATKINCVLLTDAVANFECRLIGEYPSGDHVIFVGEVLASHANQDESARRLYSIAQGESGGVVPG